MKATQFTISLAIQELLRQKSLKTTCRMHLPDAHAFDALAVSSAGARHAGVEAPPRGAVVPLRLDTRRSDADRLLIPILSVITGYQTSLLSLTGCFDPFRTLSARHSDQGANSSLLSLLES